MDRFLALVIFLLVPLVTHAESIPATITPNQCGFMNPGAYANPQAVCTANGCWNWQSSPSPHGGCYNAVACGPWGVGYMGQVVCGSSAYTCPATGGWTLSGTNCTRPDCTAGQVRDANGQCVYDCSSRAGTTFSGYITSGSPALVSQSGCEASVVTATDQCAVSGVPAICGVWEYTGQQGAAGQSQANNTLQNATSCPAGQCRGEVNGQSVCLACSGSLTGQQIVSKTVTNPDGSKDVTVTTTNYGDTTNINTTTTNYAPNGTQTGQSNSEEKGDQTTQDCVRNPLSPGCAKLGSLNDTIPQPDTRTVTLTPDTPWGGAGQCPQDVVFTLMGHTIPFKFTGACQFFQMMNPVVQAAAWVAAIFLLVTGARRDS